MKMNLVGDTGKLLSFLQSCVQTFLAFSGIRVLLNVNS